MQLVELVLWFLVRWSFVGYVERAGVCMCVCRVKCVVRGGSKKKTFGN